MSTDRSDSNALGTPTQNSSPTKNHVAEGKDNRIMEKVKILCDFF